MESRSQEMMSIMVLVYVTTFINTAFLVMLGSASLADFEIANDPNHWFFNLFVEGQDGFTDFSSLWYATIGLLLLSTLFVDIIKSVFLSMITIGLTSLKRFYDRGFTSDKYKTK